MWDFTNIYKLDELTLKGIHIRISVIKRQSWKMLCKILFGFICMVGRRYESGILRLPLW